MLATMYFIKLESGLFMILRDSDIPFYYTTITIVMKGSEYPAT